jgi:hypothetical protein
MWPSRSEPVSNAERHILTPISPRLQRVKSYGKLPSSIIPGTDFVDQRAVTSQDTASESGAQANTMIQVFQCTICLMSISAKACKRQKTSVNLPSALRTLLILDLAS